MVDQEALDKLQEAIVCKLNSKINGITDGIFNMKDIVIKSLQEKNKKSRNKVIKLETKLQSQKQVQ